MHSARFFLTAAVLAAVLLFLPFSENIVQARESTATVNLSEQTRLDRMLRATSFVSVIKIVEDENGDSKLKMSAGSGVFIDRSECLMVTNNHVITDALQISVTFLQGFTHDGDKITDSGLAEVVGTPSQREDLALIRIPHCRGTAWAPIATTSAGFGDKVTAIGAPMRIKWSVTRGIVSNPRQREGLPEYSPWGFVQTDAAINPGNSGGPLFNARGEVVGINTFIISPKNAGSVGLGFANPASLVRRYINAVEQIGYLPQPSLGIETEPLDKEQAFANDIPVSANLINQGYTGVRVKSVSANMPAALAGIEAGDILVSFNGRIIRNPAHLDRLVRLADLSRSHNLQWVAANNKNRVRYAAVRLVDIHKKPVPVKEKAAYEFNFGMKLAPRASQSCLSADAPCITGMVWRSPAHLKNVGTSDEPVRESSRFAGVENVRQTVKVVTRVKANGAPALNLSAPDIKDSARALRTYIDKWTTPDSVVEVTIVERRISAQRLAAAPSRLRSVTTENISRNRVTFRADMFSYRPTKQD